jgi:hypothetical protein
MRKLPSREWGHAVPLGHFAELPKQTLQVTGDEARSLANLIVGPKAPATDQRGPDRGDPSDHGGRNSLHETDCIAARAAVPIGFGRQY